MIIPFNLVKRQQIMFFSWKLVDNHIIQFLDIIIYWCQNSSLYHIWGIQPCNSKLGKICWISTCMECSPSHGIAICECNLTMSFGLVGSTSSPMWIRNSANFWSCNDRIFWCKRKILVWSHKWDWTIHAEIICALVPFLTTGRTWWKSPPMIRTFPQMKHYCYKCLVMIDIRLPNNFCLSLVLHPKLLQQQL